MTEKVKGKEFPEFNGCDFVGKLDALHKGTDL